jgi:hypothetical protein
MGLTEAVLKMLREMFPDAFPDDPDAAAACPVVIRDLMLHRFKLPPAGAPNAPRTADAFAERVARVMAADMADAGTRAGVYCYDGVPGEEGATAPAAKEPERRERDERARGTAKRRRDEDEEGERKRLERAAERRERAEADELAAAVLLSSASDAAVLAAAARMEPPPMTLIKRSLGIPDGQRDLSRLYAYVLGYVLARFVPPHVGQRVYLDGPAESAELGPAPFVIERLEDDADGAPVCRRAAFPEGANRVLEGDLKMLRWALLLGEDTRWETVDTDCAAILLLAQAREPLARKHYLMYTPRLLTCEGELYRDARAEGRVDPRLDGGELAPHVVDAGELAREAFLASPANTTEPVATCALCAVLGGTDYVEGLPGLTFRSIWRACCERARRLVTRSRTTGRLELSWPEFVDLVVDCVVYRRDHTSRKHDSSHRWAAALAASPDRSPHWLRQQLAALTHKGDVEKTALPADAELAALHARALGNLRYWDEGWRDDWTDDSLATCPATGLSINGYERDARTGLVVRAKAVSPREGESAIERGAAWRAEAMARAMSGESLDAPQPLSVAKPASKPRAARAPRHPLPVPPRDFALEELPP